MADLMDAGAVVAYWRSDAGGRACNGGYLETPTAPGLVQRSVGPIKLCAAGTLHATTRPTRYRGVKGWAVALLGEVQQEGAKLGALTREIINEL